MIIILYSLVHLICKHRGLKYNYYYFFVPISYENRLMLIQIQVVMSCGFCANFSPTSRHIFIFGVVWVIPDGVQIPLGEYMDG